MPNSKKSRQGSQKDRITTKPKTRLRSRNKDKLQRISILVLSLIAIGGILYIIYDIIQNNQMPVSNQDKNYSKDWLKHSVEVQTNNLVSDNVNKGYVETDTLSTVASNISEKTVSEKTQETETTEKKKSTNITLTKSENDKKEEGRKGVRKGKVYYYKVAGNNLVFSSKQFDINGDSLYEVFKILKQIKSSDSEVSFVNRRVRIIDYKVVGNTLILNLSKDVETSEYGGSGVMYAIYQIAYTLGGVAGSKNVLVLIEGNKLDYIEGEGIVFQNPIDITGLPAIN